jgi:hypothetical protein
METEAIPNKRFQFHDMDVAVLSADTAAACSESREPQQRNWRKPHQAGGRPPAGRSTLSTELLLV